MILCSSPRPDPNDDQSENFENQINGKGANSQNRPNLYEEVKGWLSKLRISLKLVWSKVRPSVDRLSHSR